MFEREPDLAAARNRWRSGRTRRASAVRAGARRARRPQPVA